MNIDFWEKGGFHGRDDSLQLVLKERRVENFKQRERTVSIKENKFRSTMFFRVISPKSKD